MRLGILTFGTAAADAAALDTVRASDVDVVLPDNAVTTHAGARAEAERIVRADCDGIVLLVGSDAAPEHVADAAEFFGVPLLVAGSPSPAFFAACGALADWGARFDRLVLTGTRTLDATLAWLNLNSKKSRQPGFDAVQKLYGQTLHLPQLSPLGVDRAQLRQQFGIRLVFGPLAEGAEADFAAPDGDANAALCRHLLRLISGQEVHRFHALDALPADMTFAQLYRRAGKYQLLATTVPEWPYSQLHDGALYGVSGNHLGALRAACEALDIHEIFIS